MESRAKAYNWTTKATDPSAEVKQPDECANRFLSPQSSTSGRGTKRKCHV